MTGRTTLKAHAERWPIRGAFRIARGEKREALVVVAEIARGGHLGRGECVPYSRYGESVGGVLSLIESAGPDITAGLTRVQLQSRLPAGAARNALDCALLDLEAKETGTPAYKLLDLPEPAPLHTAFTLSLDTPEAMAAAAASAAGEGYGLLKLKVAGTGDIERVRAVRAAVPEARLIVDANEGWSYQELVTLAPALGELGVALIEQPLKACDDGVLQEYVSPVPLCADESCHTRRDLPRIAGLYACVNVKLDKAGGLTEASALAHAAIEMGLGVMIGCMVSTSLAMAPASLLGPLADYIDLDGPLLLETDREPGLRYDGDLLYPPSPELWG